MINLDGSLTCLGIGLPRLVCFETRKSIPASTYLTYKNESSLEYLILDIRSLYLLIRLLRLGTFGRQNSSSPEPTTVRKTPALPPAISPRHESLKSTSSLKLTYWNCGARYERHATMTVEILIFGAGAVGAFYGSRLARAKAMKVSAVCRSNYNVVREHGFSISSPQYGSYTWQPSRVFSNPSEARKSGIAWNFIVVSTKALPDVSDDSQLLEGLVGNATAIVLIQNGLGVEEPYRQRFPYASILSGVTVVSAEQPRSGSIKHNRWTRINVGPYLPDPDPPNLSKEGQIAISRNSDFVGFLLAGGIEDASAYTHEKLQLVRWHKIAINAAFNPSSVLCGGPPKATMAHDPLLYEHLKGVMDEVLQTGPKVIGRSFPPEFASSELLMRSTQKDPSGSRPSMWADWEHGKALELEVILGNPIRIAREKGFSMPRLQSLYALVKMAQRTRDENMQKSRL